MEMYSLVTCLMQIGRSVPRDGMLHAVATNFVTVFQRQARDWRSVTASDFDAGCTVAHVSVQEQAIAARIDAIGNDPGSFTPSS
jgi:hypothetical protein